MNGDRIIVFVDCASITQAAERAGCAIDAAALIGYLADPAEGRVLVEAFAYLPVDPRHEREGDIALDALWSAGYLVRHKVGSLEGGAGTADLAVELALDMARAAYEMSPDTVVVATADDRLIPAVMTLRGKGIRVEVASFGGQTSRMLRQRCSGFIDLEALAEGPGGTEPAPAAADVKDDGDATIPTEPEVVWAEVVL